MKRRSKVAQSLLAGRTTVQEGKLRLGDTQGLVTPTSGKTTTVTLRLSGPWHGLWERLRAATPGVSDAELLRQGVALRMALAAVDGKGQKPKAYIQYHDQSGRLQTADLEEHVGIQAPDKGN